MKRRGKKACHYVTVGKRCRCGNRFVPKARCKKYSAHSYKKSCKDKPAMISGRCRCHTKGGGIRTLKTSRCK